MILLFCAVSLMTAGRAGAAVLAAPVVVPRVPMSFAAPAAMMAPSARVVLPAPLMPLAPVLAAPPAVAAPVTPVAVPVPALDARTADAWDILPHPSTLYARAEREAAAAAAASLPGVPVRLYSVSVLLPSRKHVWDFTFQVEHEGKALEVVVRFESAATEGELVSHVYLSEDVRPSLTVDAAGERFAAGVLSVAQAVDAARAAGLRFGRRLSASLQVGESGRLSYLLYSETGATATVDAVDGRVLEASGGR